jgi:hypothetical protein
LVGGQRGRQLVQRERVAAGGAHQRVAHGGGQLAVLIEQGDGVALVEADEGELGQARRLEAPRLALARGDEQGDGIGLQAPGDEHERLGRGAVEPVRVVDHAQQRLVVGDRGQDAEQRDRDEEAILDAVGGQPEGAVQRGGLNRRQRLGAIEHGPQQLVDPRERQLGLRLDADAGEHAHPLRAPNRVREQRRLADPRLAAEDEGAAARGAGRAEQTVDCLALALSPQEHRGTLRRSHQPLGLGAPLGIHTIRPGLGTQRIPACPRRLHIHSAGRRFASSR